MRQSTQPVSAFFLIDSPQAIETCIRELERLAPYGMPPLSDSAYIGEVRDIYAAGRDVLNVDLKVQLRWNGQEYPALVRCHSVDPGRYEIELWLPGVIANDARGMFSDGKRGFFCAFMPPAFYD
jgi:hypothetical protein